MLVGTSTFTLLLSLIMLYIFDMYNTGRAFRSADTALHIVVAVCVAAVFSAFLFYSLHYLEIRSWNLTHTDCDGLGLSDWLAVDLFILFFTISLHKTNVLIIGAGRCGTALSHLLEAEFSPYRVILFRR